jgi:hypothetical protein
MTHESNLPAAAASPANNGADRRLPPRVAKRPYPAHWRMDEFLTLAEAAALFWPNGPIRETSLRTARRDGQLAVARIAGKLLTTRFAIEEMTRNALRTSLGNRAASRQTASPAAAGGPAARASLRAKIEALVAGSGPATCDGG